MGKFSRPPRKKIGIDREQARQEFREEARKVATGPLDRGDDVVCRYCWANTILRILFGESQDAKAFREMAPLELKRWMMALALHSYGMGKPAIWERVGSRPLPRRNARWNAANKLLNSFEMP